MSKSLHFPNIIQEFLPVLLQNRNNLIQISELYEKFAKKNRNKGYEITPQQRTLKILEQAKIPYEKPETSLKAAQIRQLAIAFKDSKWLQFKAEKQSKREFESITKKIANKKKKTEIEIGQTKTLEKKLEKLRMASLENKNKNQAVNSARIEQEKNTQIKSELYKQLRLEQNLYLSQLKQEMLIEKQIEIQEVKKISEMNRYATKEQIEYQKEINKKKIRKIQSQQEFARFKVLLNAQQKIQQVKRENLMQIKESDKTLTAAEMYMSQLQEQENEISKKLREQQKEKNFVKSEMGLIFSTVRNSTSEFCRGESRKNKANRSISSVSQNISKYNNQAIFLTQNQIA